VGCTFPRKLDAAKHQRLVSPAMDTKISENLFGFFAVAGLLLAGATITGGAIYSNGPIAASGGGWATLSAVFFALWQFSKSSVRQTSAQHLDIALQAYREAYAILRNEEPNRVNWIIAARLLGRAQQSADKLQAPEHQAHYFASIEQPRRRIREQIEGKPIEFFFGVKPPNGEEDREFPERAFAAAFQSIRTETVSGLHSESTALGNSSELHSGSIFTIWKITSFPGDYDDPLLPEPHDFEETIPMHENMGLRSFLTFQSVYRLNVEGTEIVRRSDQSVIAQRMDYEK
jgi:hypothetical protein